MTKILAVGILALALPLYAAGAADLAKVNGKPITDRDLKASLPGWNEGQRNAALKDASTRRQVLVSLIEQELLTQEAEKAKLDQDASFKQAMDAYRKRLLGDMLMSRNLSSKVSDAQARKYYESHKYRYTTDQIQVQHILVNDEAQARELLRKAKEPGADFQALAERSSKDPGAKNNRGDLGFLQRGKWNEDFLNAAFAAKDGDLVGPVKTSYGYHVIKVIGRRPGKALEYEDVQLRVMSDMQEELKRGYLDKLKSQAKITIDDKALDKL
jgi:peptidyl-prolyl cis-trans isomerase C